MFSPELLTYLRDAISQGYDASAVTHAVLERGWPVNDVRAAFEVLQREGVIQDIPSILTTSPSSATTPSLPPNQRAEGQGEHADAASPPAHIQESPTQSPQDPQPYLEPATHTSNTLLPPHLPAHSAPEAHTGDSAPSSPSTPPLANEVTPPSQTAFSTPTTREAEQRNGEDAARSTLTPPQNQQSFQPVSKGPLVPTSPLHEAPSGSPPQPTPSSMSPSTTSPSSSASGKPLPELPEPQQHAPNPTPVPPGMNVLPTQEGVGRTPPTTAVSPMLPAVQVMPRTPTSSAATLATSSMSASRPTTSPSAPPPRTTKTGKSVLWGVALLLLGIVLGAALTMGAVCLLSPTASALCGV